MSYCKSSPTLPACAVLLALLCMPSQSSARTVIDHLLDFNGLTFPGSNLNGIGQTFRATDPFLSDASFALTSSPDSRVWWNDAHVQVFHGLPDSFGANGNTAIFTSPRIDFAQLPQIGTWANRPIYELQFSTHGLTAPLPLIAGDVYTITLSNFGTTGNVFYASHQPSNYPDGALVNHQVSITGWIGPFEIEDLSFKLVMIPEPTCMALCVLCVSITGRRNRRC